MAYLGLRPQREIVATSTQLLSGNGVDYEYTLNRAVSKAADITVYVGSTPKVPEVDYTASGNTLLFVSPPASGTNNISINYIAGALTTINLTTSSFPQGTAVSPAIRYVDGTSTGIYFPSTTSVGLVTSGNTRVTISDNELAVDAASGALRVTGGVGISQNLIVGGQVSFLDYTTSTDSTSGAVIVNGGLGVGENLNVGGALTVAGDFTVAGQFTTTASDSLVINDPFLFLANANPGDALDTGFVSSYTVDDVLRYSGIFRDVTDGKYKLFDNLLVSPTTTVDTANVSYQSADLVVGNLTATTIYGTIAGSSEITTVGNLANLSVAGTTSTYDIVYVYSTQASTSTSTGALQVKGGASVTGNLHASTVTASSITGTLQTASQTNITGVGTLTAGALGTGFTTVAVAQGGTGTTSSTGSGSVVLSASPTFTTKIITPVVEKSGTDGAGDIGQTGNRFATVYATTFSGVSTTAKYADVAEKYLADAEYEPGTVLHFGGEYEVSQCNIDACTRIAGVVSTNPAYIMNSELEGTHVVEVALLGRVPCKVDGPVQRGDMMVSAGNGRARAEANPKMGTVIGKALENFDGATGTIEIVVGRN